MENKPQIGLGEYLRSEREKRHITIEQVASATKINIKLLHALEGDNYDALPAKPFVRGFVTSYTRYVGLDYREVLTRFDMYLDEKSSAKFKRPADAPHIFVEREGQVDNSKTWLSIVMVGFIVIGAVAFLILKPSLKHHHRGEKKTQVSNEDIVTVVPPPSDAAPITVKPAPSPAPAPTQAQAPAPAPSSAPSAAPALTLNTQNATPAQNDELAVKKPAEKPVEKKAEPKPEPVKAEAAPKPEAPKAEVAKAEPAKSEAPKKAEPAKTAAQPKPAATPAAAAPGKLPPIPNNEVKYRLVVRALDDAWVKYQVDDRPLQQYTLKKDKLIWVRARTSIRFTTAKPSALEISYDNRVFHPFGSAAKVIILPKDAEPQFKDAPFVPPNPAYLSTPTP